MKLAEFLKAKRTEAGLSQKIVAASLGYRTAQFISNWERGVSQPPIKSIKTLSNIYGVASDFLFEKIVEDYVESSQKYLRAKYLECEL